MNLIGNMDLNEKTLREVCCSCAKLFDIGVCLLDPSQHRLAKWLNVHLGFEVKKDSKLPMNLCIDCIQDIRRWMMFRERCIKTSRLFEQSTPRSVSPISSIGSNEVSTTSDLHTSKQSMMEKWLAAGKTSTKELQVKLSRVAIKSEPMDTEVSEMPRIKLEPKLEPKVEPDSNMEAQNIQNLSKSLTSELQKQVSKPYIPGPKSKTRVPEDAQEIQGLSKNLTAALTQKMNRPMPASHKKRLQTQKQIKKELDSDESVDSDEITVMEQPATEVPSTTKPATHGRKQLSITSFMSPSVRSPPTAASKPATSTEPTHPKPTTVKPKKQTRSDEGTKKPSAGKRKSKYTYEDEDAILSTPSTTLCVVCRTQVPSSQLSKHPCFLGQTP